MDLNLKDKRPIAEGKTKKIFVHDDPNKIILFFKNDITALDGLKHDIIPGKGYINAYLTKYLFELLEKNDIPTQFVEYVFPNIVIARKITMLPIEVVCRNIAAGHLVKNYPNFRQGEKLKKPIVEFFYKSDEFHDPMMNKYHLEALDIAENIEIDQMEMLTLKANNVLRNFFDKKNLVLVDFKIEFGRLKQGVMVIGDELNGDSMRLWASLDGKKAFDKDGYRSGDSLDRVRDTYIETFKVITGEKPNEEGLKNE
jgi:phosphoribosylaminoimidazole-succinocarboxamide synthase